MAFGNARRLLLDRESSSVDNPHVATRMEDRKKASILIIIAFAWGVLATGMLVGGTLIQKMPFQDFMLVSFTGNAISLAVGCLTGYLGYKTGANSGLLFKIVYGRVGSALPVLLIVALATGWHSVVAGALGYSWAQTDNGWIFLLAAFAGGALITITTIFGIKSLEKLAIPKAILLLTTGIYACWLQIDGLGGWNAFLSAAEAQVPEGPINYVEGINGVIGSWIVGAIVMAEYTRFAKKGWVSFAIPLTALMVAQWLMQIFGAIGVIGSGSYDFIAFLMKQGAILGIIGLAAMTVALWVSGTANLYFPSVQLSALISKPLGLVTLCLGTIGTLGAFGFYTYFESWLGFIAIVAPPIIAPVICEFYLFRRNNDQPFDEKSGVSFSAPALIAFVCGAGGSFVLPSSMLPAVAGLLISAVVYLSLRAWEKSRSQVSELAGNS